MNTVLSKYFKYIQSISATELEQDLDVRELSNKLGLGKQDNDADVDHLHAPTLPHQAQQYSASPATSLWRAAAHQWQQASSQWHETASARWTPKCRDSPPRLGCTRSTPTSSPPTLQSMIKSPSDLPAARVSYATPGLESLLRLRFLSRTATYITASHDCLLNYTTEQERQDQHTTASDSNDAAKKRGLAHKQSKTGSTPLMRLRGSDEILSPGAMGCREDEAACDGTIDAYARHQDMHDTRFVHTPWIGIMDGTLT